MKRQLFLFLIILANVGFAQKRGLDYDPESSAVGQKPYEMATRHEDKIPVATFDQGTKWIIETKNCDANLFSTAEQKLFREKCGKLIYSTTKKEASIKLLYEKPVPIKDPWDCIDFWNYGDHWLWGTPHYSTAFKHYALIQGADGIVHELDFSSHGYGGMIHKYWFLSHINVNRKIKTPAKFIGIKFSGNNTIPGEKHTLYLGPVYVYKELLEELSFADLPEDMPFPTRKETILPSLNCSHFQNKLKKNGENYLLSYSGDDMKMDYLIELSEGMLNGIKLKTNNKIFQLCKDADVIFTSDKKASWTTKSNSIRNDTLFATWEATVDGMKHQFSCWYTINQKSLIIGIHEDSQAGNVRELTLGSSGELEEGKLITVPFLPYNYGNHPKLLYGDDLFFFKQFDWYYSDASRFTLNNQLADGWANYNNGVEYIPKTDGKRNPLREKLFISVSRDLTEVLPTIDNPASPMRSFQADRLWMIDGSPDYEENYKKVRKYRSLGLENVTIRYHEGFWRDGGESYTFRTNTAPGRGGNNAVRDFIRNIKDLDWRVGLYSNYTDFAPVNEHWDPDWVLREPDGNWQVSWSRCYAPKPMVAWQQEAVFAPEIHRSLGSNHSYCDVHTAVSPMSRVDYDYRVPGAATFRRTFECFGLLLLNEKKAYRGPVFSEGANHWWYAGLTDGNYANYSPRINTIPVLPDFQLYKIHPLEMDAGNLPAEGPEYLAYTLVYGHIGILNGDIPEMMKRYAFLQPLQNFYAMIPVQTIAYFNNDNEEFSSSQAVKSNLIDAPKIKIQYENGFTVYINFSENEWELTLNNSTFKLPQYGILAFTRDWKTFALSGQCDDFISNTKNYRIDLVRSPNQYYFDTYGSTIKIPDFEVNGKIFLKNEKFGWEIIPANDFEFFAFNRELIGLKNTELILEGVDETDLFVADGPLEYTDQLVKLKHQNKSVFKYRVIPIQLMD